MFFFMGIAWVWLIEDESSWSPQQSPSASGDLAQAQDFETRLALGLTIDWFVG